MKAPNVQAEGLGLCSGWMSTSKEGHDSYILLQLAWSTDGMRRALQAESTP